MATPTSFQVMQQTATELNVALRDIQAEAQRISPGDPISSCQIVSSRIISLRALISD